MTARRVVKKAGQHSTDARKLTEHGSKSLKRISTLQGILNALGAKPGGRGPSARRPR